MPVEPRAEEPAEQMPSSAELKQQGLKLLFEVGPLVIFMFANARLGIINATAVFMVATVLSLIASRLVFKRIPTMPLITGVFVLVFGALTLYLKDPTFIKIKPTIVNLMFAAVMLGGLLFDWLVWKLLFKDVFKLVDEGWRKLQFRWGLFFLALALLNEIVWRGAAAVWPYDAGRVDQIADQVWVNFKLFGMMPLSVIFMIFQMPLLNRYSDERRTAPTVENSGDGKA